MKITLTFKTPDAVAEVLQPYLHELESAFLDHHGVEYLSELKEDQEDLLSAARQLLKEEVCDAAQRWIQYGEYLRVELDTEAGTCTVLPTE
jgi:hypothetical protein